MEDIKNIKVLAIDDIKYLFLRIRKEKYPKKIQRIRSRIVSSKQLNDKSSQFKLELRAFFIY